MTIQGAVILNLVALALLVWIGNLVRRGRLYVGYGVIFIIVTLGVMLTVSVPQLLRLAVRAVGAVFPVSALTMLALGFVIFMLVYILTQVTVLSNRLTALTQALAIERARAQAERSAEQPGVIATGQQSEAQ
jgi:drug/metabolite transporter superfamily protein YnfA